ncbi:inositol monophosphatase family protein [Leptospira perolatii]|uniref:inositol monophosphatase family protein n=1 Tax=Leptospira perolatii TaxID=2023191 RepID=UPI001FB00010|nr:inositol monophosphatase [Leptospira perolatii]
MLSIFKAIANEAGKEVLKHFDGKSSYNLKDPMQVLTQADIASHEILSNRLRKEFSGIPLVLEEQENKEPLPETCIVCDELDGSALFSRGIPEFSIVLSYIENKEPKVGCIYFPASATIILAEKGKGASLNGEKISLQRSKPLSHSLVSLEINNTLLDGHFEWIRNVSKEAMASRALGATGAGFKELLEGKTDIFLNLNGAKIWDFAAGAVAVREAGGLLVNLDGNPQKWDRVRMSSIISRDGDLLEQVLRLKPPIL